jgi:hypothetical protein
MKDQVKELWEKYRVYVIAAVAVAVFVYVGFMVGK